MYVECCPPLYKIGKMGKPCGHYIIQLIQTRWSIKNRLTHTPRKTSGRGWTLVNVGLTMAIAILDEKGVMVKNEKKGRRVKK